MDQEKIDEKMDQDKMNLEKMSRTLFIGNLPVGFCLKDLKKTLSQFGKVDSIRVRCVAPSKQTLSKKVALLSKQVHPNKRNVNAYAVFKNVDSVDKALSLNSTTFAGNIIQVDRVTQNKVYVNTQNHVSVFLGNLSFKTTENELREFFNDCGEITGVRLIRDSATGIGKGFGYVTFKNKDSAVLALEKNGQEFNGREIRVKTYQYNNPTQTKKGKKNKKPRKTERSKKFLQEQKEHSTQEKSANEENDNGVKKGGNAKLKAIKRKSVSPAAKKNEFKGETASKKKLVKKSVKNRIKASKLNKQKKKIAEILTK